MAAVKAERRAKVLVLYQGDEGQRWADVIATRVRGDVNLRDRFDLRLVREIRYGAGGTALTRLAREGREAEGAIALLTQDDRRACEAGNLWHELGFWLTLKEPLATSEPHLRAESLLLVQQSGGAVTTKPISNLAGLLFNQVDTPEDAVSHVLSFLFERSRDHGGQPLEVQAGRVHRTIGFSKPTWFDERRTHCFAQQAACEFRAESTAMMAEFVRMLATSRSMADVASGLTEVARSCGEFIHTTTLRDPRAYRLRQVALARLHEEVRRVQVLGATIGARESSDLSGLEQFATLQRFLTKLVASATADPDTLNRQQAHRALEMIPEFCDWAQAFLTQHGHYKNTTLYETGTPLDEAGRPTYTELTTELMKQEAVADDIAAVVGNVARSYFDRCWRSLDAAFAGYDSRTQSLTAMIRQANRNLPHNREPRQLDIWTPI